MPRKIVLSKEPECFSVIMKMCICFFSLFALVTRKLLDKSDAHIIIEPAFISYLLLILFMLLHFRYTSISFLKEYRERK